METALDIFLTANAVALRAVRGAQRFEPHTADSGGLVRCLSVWLAVRGGLTPRQAAACAGISADEAGRIVRRVSARLGLPRNIQARHIVQCLEDELAWSLGSRIEGRAP